MRKFLKGIAVWTAIIALSLPAAAVLTFLLMPLWSWIEARFGIESVGHSGPADWCFEATGAALLLAVAWLRIRMRKRALSAAPPLLSDPP